MAIWNLGSINIDHVYRLDSLPKPGETLASRSYAEGLGGKGANQSVAAARAGSATHHLGAMGTGGEWALDRLCDAGVDVASVAHLPDEATGHAIILLDAQAENAIVIHPGANWAIPEDDIASALDAMGDGDTLLLQNETNAQVAAARKARENGARVIYSAAPFDIGAVRAILPHADILAMNEHEAAQLFAAEPGDLPVAGLLITKGAAGAEYRDLRTGQIHAQPSFPVTPVDTTGAGDTFAGFFAAALDQGDDIPAALRLAAAASALQVTRPGAGDAIPTRAEVDAFLNP
ncbi:ribokinase [Paracoccus sp. 1_MG-2023]|uniref:ribokinase n=1 Tax=unclassified Paracoccus (in: a-proteobacteria) TaxID=2688777 RepID=UPI001C0A18F1|nr:MULTISPECIES: ribokinase [unclassified Paracoccus (in: a-proteobacteria)]MBU2957296.1 ribokinase [Paracoccus sp. C2R09]MDO6669936.1 ribokinase [Paracoccus sp. 1_MG-2023]